jgi:hypothetical protein
MKFHANLLQHALTFLVLLFLAGAARAVEDIKPPFNLLWGESAERLEKRIKNAKATIVEKRNVDGGKQAWNVEGLVQTGLKRTVFTFSGGELCGVELQYEWPDWDQAKYDEYMAQVRRSIEKRFGTGQLIARKTEPEGEVMQTVVGYKWTQNSTSIELFYYSAQNGSNVFRTLSVHYKGN